MYIVDSDGGQSYAMNQFAGFLGGAALAIMLVISDYRSFKRYVWWVYGAALFSLVAVLVFGVVGGGAQSWIDVGPCSCNLRSSRSSRWYSRSRPTYLRTPREI